MIGKMRFGMAAVVILTACSLANADPVRWEPSEGGNGHWYEFVAEPRLTWCDARDAAQTREHLGETGHLTTITSPEEYGFLFDEFSDDWDTVDVAIWLGGYQPVDEPGWDPGVEPAGGWRWVDVPYLSEPEEWDYTYWGGGQPDNGNGIEHCLVIDSVYRYWNDVGCDQPLPYMVEYVPEPGSLALLALGGLVMARRR